jgi:Fe-S cluster biosynthesis and repair protein YggX
VLSLKTNIAVSHVLEKRSGLVRTVDCVILNKDLEGLNFPPYPGEFGKRVFDNVSKEAWDSWLKHQTMLVNENRINALDPDARKYLRIQCEQFLFGDGADKPEGYVPQINL